MQRVINSPYVVRLIGVIDEPECRGIVMDYFKNGSLKSFLKYLDCDCWPRRIQMLCDIAIGINYLHNLAPPIVHKDLKARNIFIDHGLMAKVLRNNYFQCVMTVNSFVVKILKSCAPLFLFILYFCCRRILFSSPVEAW